MALFGCLTGPVWSAPGETWQYSYHYRGMDAGKITYTLQQQGDQYLVRAESDLSLVANMFLDDFTIESRYQWQDGMFVLQSGRELTSQTGEINRYFEIDHVERKIRFSHHDPIHFEPGTRLDTFPLPWGMVLTGPAPSEEILYVNSRRVYRSVIKQVQPVSITGPGGPFETLRLDHVVLDKPGHIFRLWFRPGQDRVPTRIESGRKGQLSVMELLP